MIYVQANLFTVSQTALLIVSKGVLYVYLSRPIYMGFIFVLDRLSRVSIFQILAMVYGLPWCASKYSLNVVKV